MRCLAFRKRLFLVSVKGDTCVIDALLIHSFVDRNINAE